VVKKGAAGTKKMGGIIQAVFVLNFNKQILGKEIQ
jgi:hypothetical protein